MTVLLSLRSFVSTCMSDATCDDPRLATTNTLIRLILTVSWQTWYTFKFGKSHVSHTVVDGGKSLRMNLGDGRLRCDKSDIHR